MSVGQARVGEIKERYRSKKSFGCLSKGHACVGEIKER